MVIRRAMFNAAADHSLDFVDKRLITSQLTALQ